MTRLNHDRPVFKVIDAGGGERIRTIAEDLRAAQAEDRREARLAGRGSRGPRRCGACGSTKAVQGESRRCSGCLADEKRMAGAQQRLKSLRASGRLVEAAEAEKQRRVIVGARANMAERRRANGQPGREPRESAGSGGGRRTGKPNVQAAERAAEAARKELLLARTEWEKQLLRERHRRAQEALTRAQRLDRQRRSLR